MQCTKPQFLAKLLALLFCYLSSYSTNAQSTSDTITASQYFSKANNLLTIWKLDSAIVYFEKALPLYKKVNSQKRVADSYHKIAESYRKNYDLDNALDNAEKALSIRLEIFGTKHPEIGVSYNSIGHILKEQDQFQKAMENYHKALVIQLHNFGDKNHFVADCYYNIGTIHHILAKYDLALKNYNKALIIRENTFGKTHHKIADSYIGLGTTYYHLGKFKKALSSYNKALKIKTSLFGNNSIEVAFCYNYIAEILNIQDKFDQALAYQKKALFIINNVFGMDHPNAALCYEGMGLSYRNKGDLNTALENYNKALSIFIKKIGKKNTKASNIYIQLGLIYNKKGWYSESLKYYNKTLTIEEKVFPKKHPYIGSVSNNIGLTHAFKGEYDHALTYYKKAITNYLFLLGENHGAVARTYNNIANTYKAKGEYNHALTFYQKALEIRINLVGKKHSDTSASYHDIGELYALKLDFTNALLYYQKSLKIQLNIFGKNHYYTSDIYNSIATIHAKKEEYSTALEHLHKSIKIRLKTDGKHHPRTARSYNLIANVYYQKKDYTKAIHYYEKAITSNTNPNIKASQTTELNFSSYMNGNDLIHTFQGKAKVLQNQFKVTDNLNDLEKSMQLYHKADNFIQNIRQTRNNYQDKITFARQTREVYTDAIQAQLLHYQVTKNQSSLEKAFYYAEKSKANTLKDLLTESNAREFTGIPSIILDDEQKLRNERAFYISEITRERINKHTDSLLINQYENKLFDIERKQDSLTFLLEKNYPKYYQLKHQNDIISVTDIQEHLNGKTSLLEFFTKDSITYAFTISKNNLTVQELRTPDLKNKIESFRKTIISKDLSNYRKQASNLYTTLINPLAEDLKGDQLIIIPDGPLWHLNFDLLLTHQNYNQKITQTHPKEYPYLLKDYAISYANSVNVLFGLKHNNSDTSLKPEGCLAFSFSDSIIVNPSTTVSFANLRNSSTDLPGTRKEIRAISDIIDGKYYYGTEAIEVNFKKNAGRFNILHLALHGEVDNQNPENSKLFFTKSKDTLEDNVLYSHELFALNIPAELTVLSACNTGSGKIAKGEGIMSLGTAFQYAGTKSLLLTNWSVSDETTPQLMQYFYTNLKAGLPKNKALQQAKLQYLNNKEFYFLADPFYWGGLYLLGDPTTIKFSEDNPLYWTHTIVIILIISIICFFLYKRMRHHTSL